MVDTDANTGHNTIALLVLGTGLLKRLLCNCEFVHTDELSLTIESVQVISNASVHSVSIISGKPDVHPIISVVKNLQKM